MSKALSEFLEKNQFKSIFDTLDNGDSVLHVTIREKRIEILEEIISILKNVNQVNLAGHTPLQVAIGLKKDDGIIEILLKHQAKIYLPTNVFQEISRLKTLMLASKKLLFLNFNATMI